MLKLKINVNLPQLLCIVISAAENGEFEQFDGCPLQRVDRQQSTENPPNRSNVWAPCDISSLSCWIAKQ